ncbi:MAG: ABC transporter permease, partial [Bryobacteraceae bacterium]
MAFGKELWRRLLYLARRSRVQSDLTGEMEFHIECRAGELEREGISHEEALRRARREFGSTVRTVVDTHGAWQIRWIEDLLSDLRYAGRAFRRNPGFALTAVACLALGIGANTTIFSITTSFLFSQPSCRDAASLIFIWERGSNECPLADYKFLRAAHIFEATGGLNAGDGVNWRDGDNTRRLDAGMVTDDFFSNIGVPFLFGRGIAPGETTTVVISERLWRSRFAANPQILGRSMTLDGRIYSIAGVLPADNRSLIGFGWSADVYVPALHDDDRVQFYARMTKG